MTNVFKKLWLVPTLRGILAIIFGMILFLYPKVSLVFMVTLFGAFLLISGLMTLILSWLRRNEGVLWKSYFPDAFISILIGGIVFFWPQMTSLILIYLIATWALISGLIQIISTLRLREWFPYLWLNALTGVFLVLFGLTIFIHPGAGAVAISFIIGAVCIFYGILSLGMGLQLRNVSKLSNIH